MALTAPAKEITGGPWYTDQEFDYEFVKHLSTYVLSYVKEQVRRVCLPFIGDLRSVGESMCARTDILQDKGAQGEGEGGLRSRCPT